MLKKSKTITLTSTLLFLWPGSSGEKSLVRSIRANRVGILQELKTVSQRKLNSTTVFWEKDKIKITFNSYRVKRKIKRKNLNILSTFPPVLDDDKKPVIFERSGNNTSILILGGRD